MKFMNSRRIVSWILCLVLIVAMALITVGCGEKEQPKTTPATEVQGIQEATVLGEGQTKFLFTVVDKDGGVTNFEIHTDKETVGDALFELNLLEGEESQYGLYVKKVNGVEADFNVDGTYWAFYINGEYAVSGVDSTTVEEGAAYSFKVEK